MLECLQHPATWDPGDNPEAIVTPADTEIDHAHLANSALVPEDQSDPG